ncbi:MAG: glycosyltransferase family 39 protein [Pyrinomonadaceae bacterium]
MIRKNLAINSFVDSEAATAKSGSEAESRQFSSQRFWKLWQWWLAPALLALGLVLFFVDPFIGDWDGMDYTILSLVGYPSSMALGRNLFIFENHTLFVIANWVFGTSTEHAYLLFKYSVVLQSPLAIIAVWILARDLTRSVFTATIAALFLVFSPVFVLYAGQVMTDVPSVLLLAIALTIHLRGVKRNNLTLILAGAALLGLGVNLRESGGFYAPWLVLAPIACGWKLRGRQLAQIATSCAVFAFFAFAWFAYWFISDPHYRWIWFGWRESMSEESSRHPVALHNIGPFLMYLFVAAPVIFATLPFAPIIEWRRNRFSPLLALWIVGLFADVLLFFNYSTAVNWRYFLTGLPGLAPLAAQGLLTVVERIVRTKQRAFITSAMLIAVLAVVFSIYMRPVSREFIERRAMSKEYRERLTKVPDNAVLISGSQTIAVTYWASIGTGHWKTIGTGGGWPGRRIFAVIEDYLSEGRPVFLDTDRRWWLPCGWQREEIPLLTELDDHFRFRRVTETIYELRPLNDAAAKDDPQLDRLLPENRPEDTRKCPPGR